MLYLNGHTEYELRTYDSDLIYVKYRNDRGELSECTLTWLRGYLLQLVRRYVREHLRSYYWQYCGSLDDLVQDYYISFLRGRCSISGKDYYVDSPSDWPSGVSLDFRTLIDRYSFGCYVSFSSYVRRCVIRKLQDSLRSNPRVRESIDAMGEHGDGFADRVGLVCENDLFRGDVLGGFSYDLLDDYGVPGVLRLLRCKGLETVFCDLYIRLRCGVCDLRVKSFMDRLFLGLLGSPFGLHLEVGEVLDDESFCKCAKRHTSLKRKSYRDRIGAGVARV